jgi:DamX protein
LFGLLFLALFSGILGWQYPQKVKAALSYINIQLSTQEQPVARYEVLKLDVTASANKAQAAPQAVAEITIVESKLSSTKTTIKDLLVTDWNTASAKLEMQSNKVLLQTTSNDEKVDSQTIQSSEPEQAVLDKEVKAQTDIVKDYQVEDIVKFEPLSSQNGLQLGKVETVQTDDFVVPEPDLLLALPDKHFVIQIAGMANISILQNYIEDERLGKQLWLYKTQRYGGDWYVLLKNQHFPTIEAARAEIINLADAMLRNTPFVKSVGQVKQEISDSRP